MRRIIIILLMLAFALVVFYFKASAPVPEVANELLEHYPFPVKEYEKGDTLTVMSYNVGYLSGMTNNLPLVRSDSLFGENSKRLISLVELKSPDFVGFQEIDFKSKRSNYQNQLNTLSQKINFSSAYVSVNWNKRYVPFPYWPISSHFGEMISGQAILSKFKVVQAHTLKLSPHLNSNFLYKAFYLDRLAQVTDILVGEHTVRLVNLHMEAFDKETRIAQANIINQLYEEAYEKMPILIIGDFNSRPEYVDKSDAMAKIMTSPLIGSAITEGTYRSDSISYFTFNTDKPYQMIDYILYNKNFIRPVTAEVLVESGQISDHFPIMMRFALISQIDRN